jgi:hypothetical protein
MIQQPSWWEWVELKKPIEEPLRNGRRKRPRKGQKAYGYSPLCKKGKYAYI